MSTPTEADGSVWVQRPECGHVSLTFGDWVTSVADLRAALAELPGDARLVTADATFYCDEDCEGVCHPDEDHDDVVVTLAFDLPELAATATVPDDISGLLA